METVKLGEGKILVILTEEEADALGGGAEGAASSLLPVIVSSGFASVRDALTVEIFESPRGGCQIFITRETHMYDVKVKGASYRFDELSPLLCACRELALSYGGESSLSHSEGKFYLTLSEDSPIPGEFGGVPLSAREVSLLKESSPDVGSGAVERLCRLAP